MSDESSTPPADTQAPPSEPVTPPAVEPTPPQETVAPAPETPQTETPAPTEAQASVSESVTEPTPVQQSNPPSSVQDYGRAQQPQQSSSAPTVPALHGDIAKARAALQDQKRKKLDKIMAVLEGKGPPTLKLRRVNAITNDEVEKLLHVSDATATRYLQSLEKENKIKQTGSTGTGVFYEKI